MNDFKNILNEIKEIESLFFSYNVSSNTNIISTKSIAQNNSLALEWSKKTNISIALKNIPYQDIYDELDKNSDYNFKLIDGSLIQLLYTFKDNKLFSHRLCFFPSPYLEAYQNDPELYECDEIYADIIKKNIVAFPIRFDFNIEEIDSDIHHPKSHGTLGQYSNCRIPVYGPLSPKVFIKFLLKNFYSKFFDKINLTFDSSCTKFQTISCEESNELHFNFL